ncbi:hypothetical protein GCM10027594_08500 [Hymenobacter agri]
MFESVMKKTLIQALTLALLSVATFSCKKDYGDKIGPLQDSVAAIPVTVKNATYFERIPIVTTSVAGGGNVTITLQIPADKGKIKEITKVATGATLTNLQSADAYQLNYKNGALAPQAGTGTNEITFTTTLADYSAYRTRIATIPGYSAGLNSAGAAPTVTMTGTPPVVDERNPNFIRYWFQIKLEDGTDIVTTEVRARILP